MKYNLFWQEKSSDLTDLFRNGKVEGWFNNNLVIVDDSDNEGTAVIVADDIAAEFEQIADEYGLSFYKEAAQ